MILMTLDYLHEKLLGFSEEISCSDVDLCDFLRSVFDKAVSFENVKKSDVQLLAYDLNRYDLNDKMTNSLIGVYLTGLLQGLINDDCLEVEICLEDIKFDINHKINCIGKYWSHGCLRVNGILGDYAASDMSGGVIVVDGDVGKYCCDEMSGGVFVLEGDTGYLPGMRIKHDAFVLLKGHVGDKCGWHKFGGLILTNSPIDDDKKLDGSWALGFTACYNINDDIKKVKKYYLDKIPDITETRFILDIINEYKEE